MPKLRICLKLRISPSLDILGDFWTNWAENFCWCLEDYYQFNRSVLINPSYRDYFLILILLAFFRENGRGRHVGAKGSGASNLIAKLAH